jgi:hypothetical protein
MKTFLGLLAAGVLLGTSLVAQAAILKFDDPVTPGGTVSYDGLGGAALGDTILLQSIQGLGTPLNDGMTLDCVGCALNFTTGANLTEGPTLWNFGPGGTITVTGAVPALGIPAGTTLLSGTFSGTPNEITGGDGFGLFAAVGTDSKDETLAAFFGLDPTGFTFGTTNIQTATTVGANGSFTGTVVNADLNNTQAAAVPSPMTGLLLGLGMLVLGLPSVRRRVVA